MDFVATIFEENLNPELKEERFGVEMHGDVVYHISSGNIAATFPYTSIVDGKVLVGNLPRNVIVDHCIIEVLDEFNEDVTMTVGDSSAQAKLMTVFDSELSIAGTYEKAPYAAYSEATEIYAWFPTVDPIQGSARVVIIYS